MSINNNEGFGCCKKAGKMKGQKHLSLTPLSSSSPSNFASPSSEDKKTFEYKNPFFLLLLRITKIKKNRQ